MSVAAGDDPGDRCQIHSQAFELVDSLEEAPWRKVERALEVFRTAVDTKEGTWTFSE